MPDKLILPTAEGDLEIEIVPDKELAKKASLVLCVRKADLDPDVAAAFPDNEEGPCAGCGEIVVWRPWQPVNVPKVCMDCVGAALESASGPTES